MTNSKARLFRSFGSTALSTSCTRSRRMTRKDMKIPSGKPKSIVVDLTGKFLSASREVRIVTNLCVYWDHIFLSENAGAPAVKMSHLTMDSANLQYRGFSQPLIHPARTQPEQF